MKTEFPALKPRHLLSANDWNSLAVSLRKMNEITLTRTMGNVSLAASTQIINSKAWSSAMVVQIRVEQHHPYLYWVQTFDSIEAAQRALR